MKQKLADNRWIMASYEDVCSFFEENNIINKTIKDVLPFELDYYIKNLEEIDNILFLSTASAISTDGQICLIFSDDTTLEIEFVGDGPIILGYNTAEASKYPQYDGSCYTLKTLFKHCIGKKIVGIEFKKTTEITSLRSISVVHFLYPYQFNILIIFIRSNRAHIGFGSK